MAWDRIERRQVREETSERITRLEEKLLAANSALILAREEISTTANAMHKRLEGMNEFRAQLNSQAATFVTRKEMDLILERIRDDKRSDISMWISLVALLGMFVNVVLGLIYRT